MKIMDILARDAVILDLAAHTKREGLAEMAGRLAKAEPDLCVPYVVSGFSRTLYSPGM